MGIGHSQPLISSKATEKNVGNSKKAILIGVNYPGSKNELKGCINDVMIMKECLIKTCGFLEKDITLLIDTDPSYIQPTRHNIQSALSHLVDSAKPGDILFVHFSGHGDREDSKSQDDDTGYDEFIVAKDGESITDDDFRALVNRVPIGCTLTILSDSCYSGGLIEAAKVQIGRSTYNRLQKTRAGSDFNDAPVEEAYIHVNYRKAASLPQFDTLVPKTEEDDAIASPKVKFDTDQTELERHDVVLIRMKYGVESKFEAGDESEPSDRGILLSACQSHERAEEVEVSGRGSKKVYGAFCYTIVEIIKETQGQVTYRDLVLKAREELKKRGVFTQEPGLYCSDDLADRRFLSNITRECENTSFLSSLSQHINGLCSPHKM